MGESSAGHVPVMAGTVMALLGPALERGGAVLLDATLGRAGHARALLAAYPGLILIGVDADLTAIERSRELLSGYADRVTLVHAFYDEIPAIIAAAGLDGVQGVLFDLGVSSPQLDDPERGFAYSYDAPLDMRMDRTREPSAAEIVNRYPAEELARVLREYGEERFARRIADAMVRERSRSPITSTSRLSDIVREAIPAAARRTGGHPAKRTFQALRIEVNRELALLGRALPDALDLLSLGGRIVVLAYHSLEDRAVKRALAAAAADTTPPGLPVPLPGSGPRFRLLTRGALRPSAEELAANPRAASARLRAAERIKKAA
jgi:16S rRNA (cytosine1402-N4)-methyltransferase